MSWNRIKVTAARLNLAEMNIPWQHVNAHLVLDRKKFSEPTKDDNVFNAANIGVKQGKRKLDQDNTTNVEMEKPTGISKSVKIEDTEAATGDELNEEVDIALARLRVKRAKLKKKLKKDPHNTAIIAQLASVNQRLKNLAAASKARDTWAKNAEASHTGDKDKDDED